MKYSIFLFIFLLPFTGLAQNTDEELAAQYYSNGEYDKAVVLYKKLFKRDPSSIYIYQNYLSSLLYLEDYTEAEKLLEKQIRRYPDNYTFSVDLGHVYSLQGNEKKASDLYDDNIKKVQPSSGRVEALASAFMKYGLSEHAIRTYMQGRKIMHSDAWFAEELVDLYYLRGEEQKVVNECLNLLNLNAMNLPLVKSSLIRLLDSGKEIEYLQERTLNYVQRYPNNPAFDDLLMWLYMQQKKFNAAYRQSVAMDKRERGEGFRLVDLAKTCIENESYDVAVKCYEYIIALGNESRYYMAGKLGLLEASYLQVTRIGKYTRQDLVTMENNFLDFLSTFGKNWNTGSAMYQLSDIYVFYLHDLGKGIELLEELVSVPRLQPKFAGNVKLALGDAYLMDGREWDAALLYGQVDKDFKEEPLGQSAKYKNALLSFYKGDFDWSKDQLDVLKTATSQLISNDALELSLLIQDNLGLDSNYDAMTEFAKIKLLLFQNRLDECTKLLQLLPIKYPNHTLEDDIYFTRAQVAEKQLNWKLAIENYQVVVDLYGRDILADNALYNIANIYQYRFQDHQKAMETWEKIILDYPGSLYVVEARSKYRKLKEELGS